MSVSPDFCRCLSYGAYSSRWRDVEIDSPTPAETAQVVELWLALAADQRRHDAHIRADANRGPAAESFGRAATEGRLLVARETDEESPRDTDRAGPGDGDGTSISTDAATGAIVGFVSFRIETGVYERDVTRGLVENIYVVPESRGEGVGTALLAAAERRLADRGATRVTLEALAANDRARSFYRSRGYEPHRVAFEKPLHIDTDIEDV